MSRAETLLISGGHLIDPAAKIDAARDLLIRDGVVAEVGPPGSIKTKADEQFDAKGLVVTPGFIDLHVHLREPGQGYKETIASGTAAAAAGGFTSVCCMPNTQPVVDSPDWVAWLLRPERHAHVNVFPIAAATKASKGAVLTDFRALQRAGAVAVSDDGRPILSDDIMRDALRVAAAMNFPIIQHAEDTRLTEGACMHEGAASFRMGLRGMSAAAEASIVERDLQLAQQFTGARLHVAHISTADALKAVRRGKKNNVKITCEVTPHHFTLIDADIKDYDANFKMNPPLRSAADREAIMMALADGTIDAIATDHAPHAPHEKIIEFARAAFGVTGLETALGLAISCLHREQNLPLTRVIELFTAGPARVLDLRGKGSLAKGYHGDVAIIDPRKRWTYRVEDSASLSHNSPFNGRNLTGRVVATFAGGRSVYRAA